ncbi:MAG: hypothetical protein Q9182_005968 [Xanthomendoza sp. 2 TL-2023]
MASIIAKSDYGRKAQTEINLLLEHGHIYAFLNTLPATKTLATPEGHFAAANITIWLHVPGEGEEALPTDDQRSMNPNDKLANLQHCAIQFEKAWNETGMMRLRVEKLGSKVEKWYYRVRQCTEDMLPWDGENENGERIRHMQGIEAQKQHIQSLASSLQELQHQHFIQEESDPAAEAERAAEKDQLIAEMKWTPQTKTVFQETTHFSRVKPGHEDEANRVQAEIMEFIVAGAKLEAMIGLESTMEANYDKTLSKFRAAGLRLKEAGGQYNRMRIDCHQKMLRLEQCFLALGHANNFVSAALRTLDEIKTVYGQAMSEGYKAALEQVLNKRFGTKLMQLAEMNYEAQVQRGGSGKGKGKGKGKAKE